MTSFNGGTSSHLTTGEDIVGLAIDLAAPDESGGVMAADFSIDAGATAW